MALTRLSQGVLLLPILLTAISLFFNSPPALLAGAALLITLAWRYSLFNVRVSHVLASSRVERATEKSIVRQGSSIGVTSHFSADSFPGMEVAVADLIPPGGKIISGSAGPVSQGKGVCSLGYVIAFQVHGDLKFPGVKLTIRDRFFTDEFTLSSLRFQGPVVAVHPISEFEMSGGEYEYGEYEIGRIRAISGLGVRGFREYNVGDDMRHIDWKLTARHNQLIIREYMAIGGSYPLIIIDLPEDAGKERDKAFEAMVQAVTGALDSSLREFRQASLLIITGPNIVKMFPTKTRFQDAMEVIRTEVHPVPRQRSLYRFRVRSDLEAQAHAAKREAILIGSTGEKEFLTHLEGIFRAMANTGEVLAFQKEIGHALRVLHQKDVLLFSLCRGDTSHLRVLVDQLHRSKREVHLHVPVCPGSPGIGVYASAFRVDSAEVIPCM